MIWPFRRKQKSVSADSLSEVVTLPPQLPDNPCGFGFKNTWWALPTTDTTKVVTAIRLQNTQPANWQRGIEFAYKHSVFVTPPVDEWTLVVGRNLPPNGQNARDEVLEPLLELSRVFGTAFVFSTHRIVDYTLWAMAAKGTLIRGYGWVGESGTTFWDEGPMTPEEEELGFAFFDERSAEAQVDSYWDREDLRYPGEMDVMDIAREWSFSPYDLEGYKPKENRLGVLGSHSELLKSSSD